MQEAGYMESVMSRLRPGKVRSYCLADVNVTSWRTVASRVNRKEGYRKYSITVNGKLNVMAVKHNVYE